MPDLATRPQREAETAAVLLFLFQEQRERIETYLTTGQSIPPSEWSRITQETQQVLRMPLAKTFTEAARGMGAEVSDAQAERWALNRARDVAEKATQRLREMLARLGLAGLDTWLGASRAEGIAITETTNAISQGEIAAAGLALVGNVTLVAYWVTEKDGKVCEVCQPLDETPEVHWRHLGPPPIHPRCRCYLRWEIQ